MIRATVTPVAKVRQAVMMTVSPSRWQAQPSEKGSLAVSCKETRSWLARSEAEDGRRWRRADFRNRSGSRTKKEKKRNCGFVSIYILLSYASLQKTCLHDCVTV